MIIKVLTRFIIINNWDDSEMIHDYINRNPLVRYHFGQMDILRSTVI